MRRSGDEPAGNARHRWLLLGACAAILVSRRPDAILAPALWAEDGAVFFRDAHELGAAALLHPYAGYLVLVPRLIGALAALLPLAAAPAVFALAALAIHLAPVARLGSERIAPSVPSRAARACLALAYVAAPNAEPLHGNATNGQWHLCVAAFLVLVSAPPRSARERLCDAVLIGASLLTGPFAPILALVAAFLWWVRRTAWSRTLFLACAIGAAVQGVAMLAAGDRSSPPLGADALAFARIVGGQVGLAGLLGQEGYSKVASHPAWTDGAALPLIAAAACIGVWIYAWVRGPSPLRAFVLLGALVLCAALLFPKGATEEPAWPRMWMPLVDRRYWCIPSMSLVASLLWMTSARSIAALAIGAVGTCLFCIGAGLGWRLPPRIDLGFVERVRAFESAAPGTSVEFPLNPVGWSMTLVKR